MPITPLSESEKRGHEQIVYFNYPKVGLKAIVGIHNTTLGPALGGCRMRAYESEEQALDDVMRLSEGMTYKSSVAGLDLGGGKACIIADPKLSVGRKELFEKFGECVNSLGGRYITAEDMGTSVDDIETILTKTPYVTGKKSGGGGDPSPWTALGVFLSMKAAMGFRHGSEDLAGKRVALQGVGHVGVHLMKHLAEAGAKMTVCDMNEKLVRQFAKQYGADVVPPDAIYDVPCDIYSPCAIGQTVNTQTIPRLHCEIIAGAANNQLSDKTVYKTLEKRGILYCPDFVINSGGVICAASELFGDGWNEQWVSDKVQGIHATCKQILTEADKSKQPTEVVAMDIAKRRIAAKAAA